jgi:hypothetical protein
MIALFQDDASKPIDKTPEQLLYRNSLNGCHAARAFKTRGLLWLALWLAGCSLWETGYMKKPFLRVTKWLGDIPIEAVCILCPDVVFHAASAHHRPNKAEYQEKLQRSFDRHVQDAHAANAPRPSTGG